MMAEGATEGRQRRPKVPERRMGRGVSGWMSWGWGRGEKHSTLCIHEWEVPTLTIVPTE